MNDVRRSRLAELLAPAARPMGQQNMLARMLMEAPPAPETMLPPRPGYTEARNATPLQPQGVGEIGQNYLAQMAGDAPSGVAANTIMGFTGPATFRVTGPLELYHGSRAAGINALKPSERGPFGPAVYMSPAHNVARQYAGENGAMYSAPAPQEAFYGLGRSWITNGSQVNPYQLWRDQVSRLVDAAPPSLREQVAEIGGRMDPSDGYPFFRRLSGLLGGDEAAQGLFRRAGFSGVSGIVDGPEVAIFSNSVPVRQAP